MIQAIFTEGKNTATTEALTQWDKGIGIQILGLISAVTPILQFFNKKSSKTINVMTTEKGSGVFEAQIPDALLAEPYEIKAYVYVTGSQDAGQSLGLVVIPVTKRPEPDNYTLTEEYTEDMAIAQTQAMNATRSELETEIASAKDEAQTYFKDANTGDLKKLWCGTYAEYYEAAKKDLNAFANTQAIITDENDHLTKSLKLKNFDKLPAGLIGSGKGYYISRCGLYAVEVDVPQRNAANNADVNIHYSVMMSISDLTVDTYAGTIKTYSQKLGQNTNSMEPIIEFYSGYIMGYRGGNGRTLCACRLILPY